MTVGEVTPFQYTWAMFDEDIARLVQEIRSTDTGVERVWGVPRGGIIPAAALAWRLNVPIVLDERHRKLPGTLWVDDNIVTGYALSQCPVGCLSAVLVYHAFAGAAPPRFFARQLDTLPIFPWERSS